MNNFYLQDGRIIVIDFTDAKSVLAVQKQDWKEITAILKKFLKHCGKLKSKPTIIWLSL